MKFWRNFKDVVLSFYYPAGKYFLVSFPKTGQTWLMYMLKGMFKQLKNKDYFIESTHDCSEIILENGTRIDPNHIFQFNDRYRFRRAKVIFLIRDPRDVIVSHFHQVTKRSQNPFVFDNISNFVQDEKLGFKRIIYFYNLWFKNRNIPQKILIIKYEDLLTNGVNELKKIANFLDIKMQKELLTKVYQESSSSKMRRLEKENKLDGFVDFGKEINKLKVRKAKIGSYKVELSDSDIKYCNECMNLLNPFFEYKA